MCGRYVRRSDKQQLAEYFHAKPNPAELPMPDAEYNVAPTTHQPIVRQSRETGKRELVLARWGLVPYFTKDLKAGSDEVDRNRRPTMAIYGEASLNDRHRMLSAPEPAIKESLGLAPSRAIPDRADSRPNAGAGTPASGYQASLDLSPTR